MSDGAPSPPDLAKGTAVGDYVVERKIGEGGMGQVYAGVQPQIGKQVAIKVLAADLLGDDRAMQRLLEEARAVNRIRHPNIVDIFAFGTLPDQRPYFVMEFLDGEDLETTLAKDSLSKGDMVRLLEQLCQALAAAHDAGFVHRDLKPENLWVARPPSAPPMIKILDFGIAKNLAPSSPSLTGGGEVLGTPNYMAPEQVLAKTVDARTDVYSLGVILYQIFAGVLPFDDDNVYSIVAKHVTQSPTPLSKHRPVPDGIEKVVMSCLAKEPDERPQTVRQLWQALAPGLEEWQGEARGRRRSAAALAPTRLSVETGLAGRATQRPGPPDSQATVPPLQQPPHATTVRKRPRLWQTAGAALVLVAAAATWVSSRSKQSAGSLPPPVPVELPKLTNAHPERPPGQVTTMPDAGAQEARDGATASPPEPRPRTQPRKRSSPHAPVLL